MGTYTIPNFCNVASVTGGRQPSDPPAGAGWFGAPTGDADADYLTAIIAADAGTGELLYAFAVNAGGHANIQFGFDQNTPFISLDGGPLVSFNELPSGFQFLSGIANFTTSGVDISRLYTASVTMNGVTTNVPQSDGVNDFPQTINFLNAQMDPLDFIDLMMSFTYDSSQTGDSNSYFFGYWGASITGTYTTQQFSFQTQNINTPVVAGESVAILTPSPADPTHPFDPSTLDSIAIQPSDGSSPISVPSFTVVPDGDGFLIIFDWPDGMPDGVPFGDIIGTTFSGSVTLGRRITIFFTNASGIYQFVPGKTTDTLYDVDDVTTIELAIPDPFVKTGYIGG